MTYRIPDHFIRQTNEDFEDLNLLYYRQMQLFDLQKTSPSGRKFDIDASIPAFLIKKPVPIIRLAPKIAGGVRFNLERQVGEVEAFGFEDDDVVRGQVKMKSGIRIATDEAFAFEYSGTETDDGLTVIEKIHSLRVVKIKDLL